MVQHTVCRTGDKIDLNEEEALLTIQRLHKVLRSASSLQGGLHMGQFQVLLITYEYIIRDRPHLLKWVHMIIG